MNLNYMMGLKSMEIRKVTDQDLESILSIAVQAFTPIHESFKSLLGNHIFQMVYPNWIESQNNYIKQLFQEPRKEDFFVVEYEGKIVAFISLLLDDGKDRAEIGINAVSPEYSRRGIGQLMYEFALNYMKKKGIKLVEVSTGGDESHTAARNAYEKAGFTASLPLVKFYKKL